MSVAAGLLCAAVALLVLAVAFMLTGVLLKLTMLKPTKVYTGL